MNLLNLHSFSNFPQDLLLRQLDLNIIFSKRGVNK